MIVAFVGLSTMTMMRADGLVAVGILADREDWVNPGNILVLLAFPLRINFFKHLYVRADLVGLPLERRASVPHGPITATAPSEHEHEKHIPPSMCQHKRGVVINNYNAVLLTVVPKARCRRYQIVFVNDIKVVRHILAQILCEMLVSDHRRPIRITLDASQLPKVERNM